MMPEREQRGTFRVRVRPDSGVDAALYLGGQRLTATVVDVSVEGLFLKLDRGPVGALRIGAEIDVEVGFDDETLKLRGEIRSEHGDGYGIHFSPRCRSGRANPLDKFSRISAHLQRTDLSQRLKVLKLPR